MKILFISQGGPTQDYMRDCVAIGLRQLLGPDLIDVNRLDSLYQGADRSSMYGRGFSLYGELENIEVDRTDIPRKIAKKYFDLIIYGSVRRCTEYIHEVASMYPGNRIVFIDGEDSEFYLQNLGGIQFKRELHSPQPGVFPIHFAIPDHKILKHPPIKTRLMAPMDPMDKSTYIYHDESLYYAQYAESYYAATQQKAGWDCMRHYEILANWSIPYFRCLAGCPPTIMHRFPKRPLRVIQEIFDYGMLPQRLLKVIYSDMIEILMNHTRENLTTSRLALYLLDTIGVKQRVVQCA